MRFVLVDRIFDLESGVRARGIKNVTFSEDYLAHHFPHSPIMPGVLITESIVQLASWIIQEKSNFQEIGIADNYEKIKLHRIVRPGDQLILSAEIIDQTEDSVVVKGKAHCNDKIVATVHCSLTCYAMEELQPSVEAQELFNILHQ